MWQTLVLLLQQYRECLAFEGNATCLLVVACVLQHVTSCPTRTFGRRVAFVSVKHHSTTACACICTGTLDADYLA